MKNKIISMGLVGVLSLLVAAAASAQNPVKHDEPPKPQIPLKVDVVINEYAGVKKISSLPYSLSVYANQRMDSSLRMGLQVPIIRGVTPINGKSAQNVIEYQDVGTNMDCGVHSSDGQHFQVDLGATWSSVYSPPNVLSEKEAGPQISRDPYHPIFSRFSASLHLIMRNGQTIESTVATDPVSGHVIKVDVTLHVMKDGRQGIITSS